MAFVHFVSQVFWKMHRENVDDQCEDYYGWWVLIDFIRRQGMQWRRRPKDYRQLELVEPVSVRATIV